MRDFRKIVKPADALVVRDAIGEEDRDILDAYHQLCAKRSTYNPKVQIAHANLEFGEMAAFGLKLLQMGAGVLGVPAPNTIAGGVIEYKQGDAFYEHTDLIADAPDSYCRTLSFSLLLSGNYTGGDLVVNGRPVIMGVRDVALFTSMTPHSVKPVLNGKRKVWVAFGSVT